MDTQAKCGCKTQFSHQRSGDNLGIDLISSRLFPFLAGLENVRDSIDCSNHVDDCTQLCGGETISALRNLDNLLTDLIPVIPPPYYNINNLYKYLFI